MCGRTEGCVVVVVPISALDDATVPVDDLLKRLEREKPVVSAASGMRVVEGNVLELPEGMVKPKEKVP